MKKFMILFVSALLMAMTVGAQEKDAKVGKIVKYEYKKTGMRNLPLALFRIENIDDKQCLVSFFNHDKDYSNAPIMDEEHQFFLDKTLQPVDLLNAVQKVFEEHKMWEYKTGYYPPEEIRDGYSWNLSIVLDNGKVYHSHGNNAGPDDNGMSIIQDMLAQKIKGLR